MCVCEKKSTGTYYIKKSFSLAEHTDLKKLGTFRIIGTTFGIATCSAAASL